MFLKCIQDRTYLVVVKVEGKLPGINDLPYYEEEVGKEIGWNIREDFFSALHRSICHYRIQCEFI